MSGQGTQPRSIAPASVSGAPPAAELDLSAGVLAAARADAAVRNVSITQSLQERAGLPPAEFVRALGAAMRMRVATMEDLHRWTPAFDLLPFDEAIKQQCVLFKNAHGSLRMVMADPFNAERLAWGDARIARSFRWVLTHQADLAAFLARQEETRTAMDSVSVQRSGDAVAASDVEELSLSSISKDQSPVIRLVNSTLYDAHKAGASDIHLETGPNNLVIKYRIDGVLNSVSTLPGGELPEQVISRIKVMSDLDIAERRVPQDGRFKVAVRGREVDFRVSIMPSVHGEDAVLRILDKQSLTDEAKGLTLEALGFAAQSMRTIRRMAAEPYGMLLVTGPTGSGKTTTLYGAISETNTGRDKIITIEDPVEYQLPGVLQIPVNEKKGLTFARGLRSILRHDPDKVMVGEIRDPETAQIAIQAALTGHLVFTTVHANNVFDVLGRFTHMEVDPYSFVAALNGIVAQRLVRVTCSKCIVVDKPTPQQLVESGLTPNFAAGYKFMTGRGCGHCRGTGYKGRKAIAEILTMTDELRELIVARAPIRQLKDAAKRGGTLFLREAALALVAAGETDLREINRVTFVA